MSIYKRSTYMPLETGASGIKLLNMSRAGWQQFRSNLIFTEKRYVLQEEANNLPLLSYKIYGNSQLWWILARVNGVINPFAEMPAGREIAIPSADSINIALNKLKATITSDKTATESVVTFKRFVP